MPLIAYKLILISLDLQRLRELAQLLQDAGHEDHAIWLRSIVNLAEEI